MHLDDKHVETLNLGSSYFYNLITILFSEFCQFSLFMHVSNIVFYDLPFLQKM